MATPARSRSPVFKAVAGLTFAFAVVAIVVAGAEGILRVLDVGHPSGFVRAGTNAEGKPVWRENRWVTAPYFPESLVRRPVPFELAVAKAPNAYRIVVLGSSAAQGDPEPAFGVARVAEVLLAQAFPEIEFEVVNAAITAVNSHVVREIAADCAALKPDAYFVYEGNNEVIGPYGPAAVTTPVLSNPAWIRLSIAAQHLRLAQALRRLKEPKTAPAEWGGLKMFLRQTLSAEDPKLAGVNDHFRRNLTAIVETGREAGAAVFLSTVLVNQRDFAPFASTEPVFARPADAEAWRSALASGKQALASTQPVAAAEALRRAARLAPGHAETIYLLSVALRASDANSAEADALAARAVDLDALRFRTDARLNQTIREVAETSGATLLDCAQIGAAAPGGLGNTLLHEHVHLTMQGTYLVARALVEGVRADLLRRGRIQAGAPRTGWADLASVRRMLAYSPYEQALILQELENRFSQAPFTGRWGNDEHRRELHQREQTVLSLLAEGGPKTQIYDLYRDALKARPTDAVLWRNFGMASASLGDPAAARDALTRSLALMPDDTDALAALLAVETRLRNAPGAQSARERLFALEPRHPGLRVSKN